VTQQINLFNPVFLKQEKYFSAATMAQGLGLIIVACIGLGAYATYRAVNVEREAGMIAAQLKNEKAQLDKLSKDTKPPQKSKAVKEELDRAEQELAALRQVSDVLGRGEVGNTLGYSEYLRAFARQIVDGVWLTGFNIQGAGSEITLQGRALQAELIPVYIGQLRREPVMKGKSFAALEINLPEATAPAKGGTTAQRDSRVAARPVNFVEFNLHSSLPQAEKRK
jgi:Tfp pilus assembly protein PilN